MAGSNKAGFKFMRSDFRVHAVNCCALLSTASHLRASIHHFLYLEGSPLPLYLLPGTLTGPQPHLDFSSSDLPSQEGTPTPMPLDLP